LQEFKQTMYNLLFLWLLYFITVIIMYIHMASWTS